MQAIRKVGLVGLGTLVTQIALLMAMTSAITATKSLGASGCHAPCQA